MKKALWITLGRQGNAGDALLYDVTRALFRERADLRFRSVNSKKYARWTDGGIKNVVVGPGGLFVQTNSARHLHRKLGRQWRTFESKRFLLWSTGILSDPSPEETAGVRRVIDRSAKIVVRARREAEFIAEVTGARAEWAPCASLFTDKLLAVPRRVDDVVVVNLDEVLFTPENIAGHPMRRFRDYAEAQGLAVRSMVNAVGDSNPLLLDLFPLIDADEPILGDFLRSAPTRSEFFDGYTAALRRRASQGDRYTNARFAFGKRLHGWLPFMAFDRPAAFIGMEARRGMPRDYFGNNDFLCDVPRRRRMTQGHLDAMATKMIRKLDYFIKHEDALVSRIAERREELWGQLQRQADVFVDAMR